jgi:hypothetical protein
MTKGTNRETVHPMISGRQIDDTMPVGYQSMIMQRGVLLNRRLNFEPPVGDTL